MPPSPAPPSGQTVLPATILERDALCALYASGVQEAIRPGPPAPVRYALEEAIGIVNLRGKIAAIIDVGLRLGLRKVVAGSDSRMEEVVEVERDRRQPPTANRNRGQTGFRQVWRARDRVIPLLDDRPDLRRHGAATLPRINE